MDGNRTHPGRLNSAPQTVLKTAFLAFASVQCRRVAILAIVVGSFTVAGMGAQYLAFLLTGGD